MKTPSELQVIIDELEHEIAKLRDENESLWFLLEELEKSNVADPRYKKQFEEAFGRMRQMTLMTINKAEEA
tara:strand:+ start:1560 stop:1772 length:213 start_codon:yes stop_codon:yes gene_type:complete